MASSLTWLDFSEAQQEQIRNALKDFEDKGTVDDLGFGTIRDSISNALFPGTSIIQTRARYFLFIPWIFERAYRKDPLSVVEKSQLMERKLISALKHSDDTDGVIGRTVGNSLKTLPSAIYWSGLQTFGIFKLKGKTIRQFGRLAARARRDAEFEGEFIESEHSFWCEMPPPPSGFFKFELAELALTRTEADWICERFLSTEKTFGQSNLLSDAVRAIQRRESSLLDAEFVWNLDLRIFSDKRTKDLVDHARKFALLSRGASLLYNAMVVEARKEIEKNYQANYDYQSELHDWATEATSLNLREWCSDMSPFWNCLADVGARVAPKTREFVNDVASGFSTSDLSSVGSNPELRTLIKKRETAHKGSQARLANRGRLLSYTGEAGVNRLTYRWDLVRRLLGDVDAAFERDSA